MLREHLIQDDRQNSLTELLMKDTFADFASHDLGRNDVKKPITENGSDTNQSIFNDFMVQRLLDHPGSGLASITLSGIHERKCTVIEPSFRVSIVWDHVRVRIQIEMLHLIDIIG